MNVDACTSLPITTAMSRLDLGIGVSLPGPLRRWRRRLDAGVSAVTAAKAYRLLKAVLNTAADDG